jgi:hypothetical protein
MTARAQRGAQKPVSREDILAVCATPESFNGWLQQQAPDAEVGGLQTSTNTALAEYLWAVREVFALWAGMSV